MRKIGLLFLAAVIVALPASSLAQFSLSITIAPPALPVYEQPEIPADGYLWTPGYWANGDEGYFWVPGTWVMPPEAGLLWTPGYWGWNNNAYAWNGGYWGGTVGFYGGVNYGFGYGGSGYEGGYWNHGSFSYNRSVNNVNVTTIHNVYNKTVITTETHVSYNGGSGGVTARPTAAEETAARQPHTPPTAQQSQHIQAASTNHQLLASVNQGRPAIAATAKPGELSGHGVVAAKQAGAPYKAPEKTAENKPAAAPAKSSSAGPKAATDRPATASQPGAHPSPSHAAAPAANENKPAQPKSDRPATASKPAEAPSAAQPHSQPAPRSQSSPRPQSEPREATAPAPRSEAPQRPQSAPHAAPAEHSQPAPRASSATPTASPKKEAPKSEEHPHQ